MIEQEMWENAFLEPNTECLPNEPYEWWFLHSARLTLSRAGQTSSASTLDAAPKSILVHNLPPHSPRQGIITRTPCHSILWYQLAGGFERAR
jgi:hypothetical protein